MAMSGLVSAAAVAMMVAGRWDPTLAALRDTYNIPYMCRSVSPGWACAPPPERLMPQVTDACVEADKISSVRGQCFMIHLVLQVSRRLADPLVAAPLRAEEGGAVAAVQEAEAEAAHHRR